MDSTCVIKIVTCYLTYDLILNRKIMQESCKFSFYNKCRCFGRVAVYDVT